MIDDFAAMGVIVEQDESRKDKDLTAVWDINWPSFTAFLDCETQWRVVSRGMAGLLFWLGLDYSAVDVVLRRRKAGKDVFDDIRLMEREALSTFDRARADD